jgi:hypothetical protein
MNVLVGQQKLLGVNLTNSQHVMYLLLNSLLKFGLNIRKHFKLTNDNFRVTVNMY